MKETYPQRQAKKKVAILGASGYTGTELLRLLEDHPSITIAEITSERHVGKEISDIFPHLKGGDWPRLEHIDNVNWHNLDIVFCALPHGLAQDIVPKIPSHLRIIDLSADFRLSSKEVYSDWYGCLHRSPACLSEFTYGLPEVYGQKIKTARLIANPGCYPTASLLPLIPLAKHGAIDENNIIIDAKSGVSGAGRSLKETSLFSEVSEDFQAYGATGHRHIAEIEQELALTFKKSVRVSFLPHLLPINRGILATIYVQCSPGFMPHSLHELLMDAYQDASFVRVVSRNRPPAIRHVRGSNVCLISVVDSRHPSQAILVSVIDNLIKGASGQAIQNMNRMLGINEQTGLPQRGFFP